MDQLILEGYLNGYVSPREVNQSSINKQYLSDRQGTSEYVDPISGGLTIKQNDITLPGKDGLDLSITRIYNSSQAEPFAKKVSLTILSEEYRAGQPGWYATREGYNYILNKRWTEWSPGFDTWEECANWADTNWIDYQTDPYTTFSLYEIDYEDSDTVVGTYFTYDIWNVPDRTTYLRNRYDLGAGWSFAFPSIQVEVDSDKQKHLFFHDGTGAVYEVDSNFDSQTNLIGYQGMEVKFSKDSGTYCNGTTLSAYVFTAADQRKTYFASDGRLLGIVDRFGNKINFKHTYRNIEGKNYPFISSIVDTIGRTIEFIYTDDSDGSSDISVNVKEPSSQTISFIYHKGDWIWDMDYGNTTAEIAVPHLEGYSDSEGRYTSYRYKQYRSKFNFLYKDLDESAYMDFWLLEQIDYVATSSIYDYEVVTRNLGADGLCTGPRVTKRNDNRHFYTGDFRNCSIWDGLATNAVEYSYYNDYTGYPQEEVEDYLSSNFQFSSTEKSNGVTTTNLYNGTKQQLSIESKAINGETKTTKNLIFNNNWSFRLLPTKTEICEHTSTGIAGTPLYIEKTYNDWGGLASYTLPLTSAQLQNTTLKEVYTTKIQFHPVYKFVTDKQWYKDNNTLVHETSQYDDNGRLIKSTNANAVETNYKFSAGDQADLLEMTTQLENGKIDKTVTYFGTETKKAFPTVIKKVYTDENNVVKEVYTYNKFDLRFGLVSETTDDLGRKTTYTYDVKGRPTSIIYPDFTDNGKTYQVKKVFDYKKIPGIEFTTETPYENYCGTLVRTRDIYVGNGQTIAYNVCEAFYDGFGNLIQQRLLDCKPQEWNSTVESYYNTYGSESTYFTNSLGHPVNFIKDARYVYDTYGRVVTVKDAQDNQTNYSYDSWGNLSEVTDEFGNLYKNEQPITQNKTISYFVYQGDLANFRLNPTNDNLKQNYFETNLDQWGRVINHKVFPNWPDKTKVISESFGYDIVGNVVSFIDPKQNPTEYKYDNLNQLREIKDARSQITKYDYTANGKLSYVSQQEDDKVYATKKAFNELGSLTNSTDAGGLCTQYTVDGLGRTASMTDPNLVRTNYIYDRFDRLLEINTDQLSIKNSYGAQPFGLVNSKEYLGSDVRSSLTYTYTPRGFVDSVTTNGDVSSKVSYGYDLLGRPTDLRDPFGFNTKYIYNKTRLDKIQTNGSVEIDPTGTSFIKYDYCPDGKISTITYPTLKDGSILKTVQQYNKLNQLIKVTNYKGNSILSNFEYTYDLNGNIETIADSTGITTYGYDSLNRLTQITRPDGKTISYTYDVRGNRKSVNGDSLPSVQGQVYYEYNQRNQLTKAINDQVSTSCYYDPNGLRIKKTSATGITRYHYNTSGQVIAESDAANNVTANFVWGPDRVLVKKENSGDEYFYLYNGHGDVVQIVDTNGNVVNDYKYDEWGNIVSQTETIQNPFKYCGEVYDEETGLYYLRARYYDPSVGRFINKDTYQGDIANPLTLNLYTYCANNPIIFIDPTGHEYGKLRDFWEQTVAWYGGESELLGNSIQVDNEKRTVSIVLWEGSPNEKKATFYFDDYKINGGRIYLQRNDFFSKMGIEYDSDEYLFDISAADNRIERLAVNGVVTLSTLETAGLTSFIMGYLAGEAHGEIQLSPGTYKLVRTLTPNPCFPNTAIYHEIRELYKLEKSPLGNSIWVWYGDPKAQVL